MYYSKPGMKPLRSGRRHTIRRRLELPPLIISKVRTGIVGRKPAIQRLPTASTVNNTRSEPTSVWTPPPPVSKSWVFRMGNS